MKVILSPYNEKWQERFRSEAAHITDILGDNLLQIFHIGSTSVPGLPAKPIIDIMPVLRNIEEIDGCTEAFESLGYEVMGEFGMPGRRYMRKGGDNRTHQIHAFGYNSIADITRHLAFRDYLKSHPDICAAYAELKSQLALLYPADIEAYSMGKDSFVKQAERDALQWYWHLYPHTASPLNGV